MIGRIDLDRLIFLDESGVSKQMTRLNARCRGGARIHETTRRQMEDPHHAGRYQHARHVATMTIEAATDREIFLAYLDKVLCPQLRPGDVVVMDDLSSHKVQGVPERIEAAGAQLLYLPPYSRTSTPLKKHGPNSSNCYARTRPGPKKHSIRPSSNCCPCLLLRMQKLGSGSRLTHYSNRRNTLK